jgi:hypothetical protein
MKNIISWLLIIAIILLMLPGCFNKVYTVVYDNDYFQTVTTMTPESALKDYNYICFYYNGHWYTDKLRWYKTINSGRNIIFEIETISNKTEQYFTSINNVQLIMKK